jgi:hypothetical protein
MLINVLCWAVLYNWCPVFRWAVCDTDHYLLVTEVRKFFLVRKRVKLKFSVEILTFYTGHLHIPQCETDANIVMLGTVTPAPADVGLNLDDK